MLQEIIVRIDDIPVGRITPHGRYLERKIFHRLRPVNRLRAYLALVAPRRRRARVLALVCGVSGKDVSNFLKADLRRGRVFRSIEGYAMNRECIPLLRTTSGAAGDGSKR